MDTDKLAETQRAGEKESPSIPVKWEAMLTEGAKIAFLCLFCLYVIGFIIWHSYLADYGVTTVEFLQTEYLAAAFCYFFLFIPFAVPPLIVLESLCKRPVIGISRTMFIVLFVFWQYLVQSVSRLYFPDYSQTSLIKWMSISIIILAVVHYVSIALINGSKLKERSTYRFFASRRWVAVYLVGIPMVNLLGNPAVKKAFLLDCIATYSLVVTVAYWAKELMQAIGTQKLSIKTLTVVFIGLCLINNVRLFGSYQFGAISKAVGGGQSENAMLKIATNDPSLSAFALAKAGTNASGTFGPVAILLRTEREVIYIDASDVGSTNKVTATQMQENLIEAIRYIPAAGARQGP